MRIWPKHYTIVARGQDYLRRWLLTPWSADSHPFKHRRRPNIYLHHILASDDDRALHDHPWDNLSIVLWGGYTEHLFAYPPREGQPLPPVITKRRRPGSIVYRKAEQAHRLELNPRWKSELLNNGRERPCWSLFITWRKRREWGFWCEARGLIGETEYPILNGKTVALQTFGMVGRWVHQQIFIHFGASLGVKYQAMENAQRDAHQAVNEMFYGEEKKHG